ncbi:MAG: hypothetical protein M1819_000225 [Sarea resinae]|nr:MAG: hypothetical protein M1819_000225 [Sarea resinae]
MSKKVAVPDAWDDDWEAQADQHDKFQQAEAETAHEKISRAERLAKHAEENKKLWDSAETPQTFHFLEARSDSVPLKSDFKPAVKVLSRKPAPRTIVKTDPVAGGISQITLADDDDEDDDDAAKRNTLSPEEQRLKAQRDREEKQRRYEEVRQRLFGTPDPSAARSGSSSPVGSGAPSRTGSGAEGKASSRGRRKGKLGGRPDGRPITPADAVGMAGKGGGGGGSGGRSRDISTEPGGQQQTRHLYDPEYTAKPDSVYLQRRDTRPERPERSTSDLEQQPIRAPRGPDGSGRGGFGFAARGGRPA